jgi:hypothetical protein
MLLGIAPISGGIATGAAVEWQLIDTLVHFARRSSRAIITVPMLIILGVAATAIGAIVLRLPVEDATTTLTPNTFEILGVEFEDEAANHGRSSQGEAQNQDLLIKVRHDI